VEDVDACFFADVPERDALRSLRRLARSWRPAEVRQAAATGLGRWGQDQDLNGGDEQQRHPDANEPESHPAHWETPRDSDEEEDTRQDDGAWVRKRPRRQPGAKGEAVLRPEALLGDPCAALVACQVGRQPGVEG